MEDKEKEAKILSHHERDSFTGQTIDEDGTVHDQQSFVDQQRRKDYEDQFQGMHEHHFGHLHFATNNKISWRVKLALGFIVFCILAVIIGALGLIVMAMPYLLGIFVIYCLYSILSSLFKR